MNDIIIESPRCTGEQRKVCESGEVLWWVNGEWVQCGGLLTSPEARAGYLDFMLTNLGWSVVGEPISRRDCPDEEQTDSQPVNAGITNPVDSGSSEQN